MKHCKVCSVEFNPRNSLQKVCSVPCARKYAKQQEVEKKRKEAKRNLREFNKNNLAWQHKQTQKVFNRMRVLQELKWFKDRGLEPTCISCQKPLGNDVWCCGHKKTQGGNSRLRYDENNTFLQHNVRCNMNKSGDIEGYEKGLYMRFGNQYAKHLIDYQNNNTGAYKWSCDELELMRSEFNQEIRKLEKDLA